MTHERTHTVLSGVAKNELFWGNWSKAAIALDDARFDEYVLGDSSHGMSLSLRNHHHDLELILCGYGIESRVRHYVEPPLADRRSELRELVKKIRSEFSAKVAGKVPCVRSLTRLVADAFSTGLPNKDSVREEDALTSPVRGWIDQHSERHGPQGVLDFVDGNDRIRTLIYVTIRFDEVVSDPERNRVRYELSLEEPGGNRHIEVFDLDLDSV